MFTTDSMLGGKLTPGKLSHVLIFQILSYFDYNNNNIIYYHCCHIIIDYHHQYFILIKNTKEYIQNFFF